MDGQTYAHFIWTRLVNCTWNEGEQNLQAYRNCGKIYYETLKTIAHTQSSLSGMETIMLSNMASVSHKVIMAIIEEEYYLHIRLLSDG